MHGVLSLQRFHWIRNFEVVFRFRCSCIWFSMEWVWEHEISDLWMTVCRWMGGWGAVGLLICRRVC